MGSKISNNVSMISWWMETQVVWVWAVFCVFFPQMTQAGLTHVNYLSADMLSPGPDLLGVGHQVGCRWPSGRLSDLRFHGWWIVLIVLIYRSICFNLVYTIHLHIYFLPDPQIATLHNDCHCHLPLTGQSWIGKAERKDLQCLLKLVQLHRDWLRYTLALQDSNQAPTHHELHISLANPLAISRRLRLLK